MTTPDTQLETNDDSGIGGDEPSDDVVDDRRGPFEATTPHTDDNQLEPCPWCNGNAMLRDKLADGRKRDGKKLYWVMCPASLTTDCLVNAKTRLCDTPEEAIRIWNTRISPASTTSDRIWLDKYGHRLYDDHPLKLQGTGYTRDSASATSAAPTVDTRELGADTNFPLSETLMLSVEWLQHLHDSHECDCHGWEQRSFLIKAAQRYREEIKQNSTAATAAPVEQSDEQYVVIDGERRRVIPCPDNKPDCEVLHTEPVTIEGAR